MRPADADAHAAPSMGIVAAALAALRPRQWVKNFFVLAPLLFAQQVTQTQSVLRSLAVMGLFCAASSAVYLLNDLADLNADRVHPKKRHRPLASGALPAGMGIAMSAALALLALGGAAAMHWTVAIPIAVYLAANLAYSLGLKHVVILDAMLLASGFVLRVIVGAVAIGVETSHWLLLCTSLLALMLGFGKRRQELVGLQGQAAEHRPVLREYTIPFLDHALSVLTGATVISYALYTVSEDTVAKFGSQQLIYTVPFVLYGLLHYLHLVHQGRAENPTEIALKDRPLQLTIVGWLVVVVAVLY